MLLASCPSGAVADPGLGRVTQVTDAATGVHTWNRTGDGGTFTVTSATPLGRTTRRTVSRGADESMSRSTTDAAGLLTRLWRLPDGSVRTESPDGTIVTSSNDTDLPLDISVVHTDTTTVLLPSALKSTVVSTVERTLVTVGDPLSVSGTSVTVQRLGAAGAWELSHDVGAALIRVRTPEGRQAEASLDAKGRATSVRSGTDAAVSIIRDGQGRPTQVQQGGRTLGMTYGANGMVSSTTDPLSRTTQYFYDAADRLTRGVLADGREITFGYDARGNPTSVTPAGRPAHTFAYDAVNLVTEYRPPAVDGTDPATRFTYDKDRAVTRVQRPDGLAIDVAYDAAGRVSRMTFPGGLMEYGYDPLTGSLTGINGPYGGALSTKYDGALLKEMVWIGEVRGSVSAVYDSDFSLSELQVNGSNPVSFGYDSDGMLVRAGLLSVTRDVASGRATGTVLGGLTSSISSSDFGVLKELTWRHDATPLLNTRYTRDALDRIGTRTEVVGGVTTVWTYSYDLTGRLTQVDRDGVPEEAYTYDANGNRTSLTNSGGVIAATYDAQDRLLTYGANSYEYTANGELTAKTRGPETTRYAYDVLGNLLAVELPNGTQIDYLVDPMGRRIGRKVDGVLQQGWLYQDGLNPIAELDAGGSMVTRFVYGARAHVPEYMERDGATYRLVSDELGSVRLVVDVATGDVVQELRYDAWGRVLTDTNPGFQPFGYAGGVYDPLTGLVRFGARDYDAEVGRWTAKDPRRLVGGLNFYGYAYDDPINLIDVTGRVPRSNGGFEGPIQTGVTIIIAGRELYAGYNRAVGDIASRTWKAAKQKIKDVFEGWGKGEGHPQPTIEEPFPPVEERTDEREETRRTDEEGNVILESPSGPIIIPPAGDEGGGDPSGDGGAVPPEAAGFGPWGGGGLLDWIRDLLPPRPTGPPC